MDYFVKVWFVIKHIKTQQKLGLSRRCGQRKYWSIVHKVNGKKIKELRSEKMSKSKKNIVDPVNIIKKYGLIQQDYLCYLIVLQKENLSGLIAE